MKKLTKDQKVMAHTEYQQTLKCGMFWEWYPQLSGNWQQDKEEWETIYLQLRCNKREVEKRYAIPVCNKHGRFQSRNGHWLDIKYDLEEHLKFTNSYDAIQTEGECDKCVDKNQVSIDFSGINGNCSGEE